MVGTKISKPKDAPDLAPLLDRLYAAPSGDFTRVRKALVAELRAQGRRAAADALAGTKRPTRGAWALNQVSRRHPGDVAAFLATVARVRAMQKRALEHRDTDAVREAGREMNAGVSRIVALAVRVLEEDGAKASSPLERALAGGLRAVTFASPEDLERFTRGTLDAEMTAPDDLSVFGALDFEATSPPTRDAKDDEHPAAAPSKVDAHAAAEAKRRAREEEKRAQAEAEERAREIAKLEQVAKDAERVAARREREAEAAAARARRLEEEARTARQEAAKANAAVERARAGRRF